MASTRPTATQVLKRTIKAASFKAFPDASLRLFSIRLRRLIERDARERGLDALARAASNATEGKVLGGPFRGMRFDCSALPVHNAPKLAGTYEREIAPFVEEAIRLCPGSVLNVGASDGYYAVGLALRLPHATIYAAEADPKSARATQRNARLNGVERRVVRIGIVHPGEFASYLDGENPLLVMDVEGAEFALLDPRTDPVLECANILVEVHREFGSAEQLATRFAATHEIHTLAMQPRACDEVPDQLKHLGELAVNELRSPTQVWMFLEASNRACA